ncbi:MAG: NAD(P)-dependent oxidoreductase [Verrucomicrobia bacterium]|nr:MAG: NAD(P)-dependent oxidoreductase [Verrucomicrobiota bacterium]
MNKIWITGAGGLIGNYLAQTAHRFLPQATILPLTRKDLDLTDFTAVRRAFQAQKPDLIIHCAALSQSPECEANPALARRLNVQVTAELAQLAAAIPFFFYSTDLVFDGRQGNYDEHASVNPLGVYAQTKVEAEKIVLSNPRHTVIRTSLNGGVSPTGDRGFNEKLRVAFQAGKTLDLFTDEFRSPIPAEVTAEATWELVLQKKTGRYHVSGSERLSRFQMGQLVAARWPQLNPNIVPGSLKNYAGAPRPPDTSLNCAKVQQLLSFRLPRLSQWLDDHADILF